MESVTQAVSNLALEFGDDNARSGAMVCIFVSIKCIVKTCRYYTRKNAQLVVTDLQTSCYKAVHKLSTSCVHTACSQLLEQVWNKLLTTCNKLDGIIRLVTRLFLRV